MRWDLRTGLATLIDMRPALGAVFPEAVLLSYGQCLIETGPIVAGKELTRYDANLALTVAPEVGADDAMDTIAKMRWPLNEPVGILLNAGEWIDADMWERCHE